MNVPRLAVVILNYNGRSFLETFLPFVIAHSKGHQLFVADNASTDDSIPFLNANFPQVQLLRNPGNYGFAKGYNLALEKVKADYYVLLNSDVQTTDNWIEPILELLEKNPEIAACQPKILDYANPEQFEYAGAAGGYIDKYAYPFCRGRIFNSLETDKHQFDDTQEVFWATGACLFVRSDAFWKVGGFDSDYFAHMEEIDLCWRLKNIGYKIFVEPRSSVLHVGGGTLHKLSAKKTFLNFRNNITTLAKNHEPRYLFFKILFRLFLDGVAGIKFLLDGQPKHMFAVLKAHFNFYVWLPGIIRKRKSYKTIIGFKFNGSKIYNGNIVAEHFIRNKTKFEELRNGFFSE